MTRIRILFIFVLGLSCVPTVRAQLTGGGSGGTLCSVTQHINQLPPDTVAYQMWPTIEEDWEKFTISDIIATSEGKGIWRSEPAYACAYMPCGEIVPPNPSNHASEKEYEVCLTVGAGVGVEAQTELKVKLLAKVGVAIKAEWNIQAAGCLTTREAHTYFTPRFPCYETLTRDFWTEKTATGEVETATERIRWQVRRGSTSAPWETVHTFCWYNKSTGEARDFSLIGHHQAPFEGYPLGNPDIWDGVRAQRCCEDSADPNEPPCCGCYAAP